MRQPIAIALLFVWDLFGSSPARAGYAEDLPAPKTVLEAKLLIDRRERHPGEAIELKGVLTNVGGKALKLPLSDSAREFTRVRLYIATPDGETFQYEPYAGHPLRSSLAAISPRSFGVELVSESEHRAFQKSLRLAEGFAAWSSREHPRGPLSLRKPGQYKFWFEYQVPAVDGAPEAAWSGSVRSDTVTVTVAAPREPVPNQQPTPEQFGAIQTFQSVAPTAIDGRDVLQQAMLRAESEPLAERLTELCLKDARRSEDFIAMLMWRACDPESERRPDGRMQLGIDGPYLKTAALAVVDAYENPAEDPNHHRIFRSTYGVNLAIAYLRFHPEDQPLQQRFVKLARASAPLPKQQRPAPKKLGGATEPPKLSIPAAWKVLLELDVLHAGMTIAQAVEILGPPSGESQEDMTWYVDTPRHVNPALSATLKGKQVISFRRSSR